MYKYFVAVILLSVCMAAGKKRPAPRHFTIQKLSEGVWAAIHSNDGGYAICNAGIVDLGDKTLIFDAFINPAAADELRRVAEELTHRPAAILVNSHYHDDHVRGNQAFEQAVIVSTAFTKSAIATSEPEERRNAATTVGKDLADARATYATAGVGDKAEAKLWVNYYEAISGELPGLKLVLPNVGFNDSLVISGTKRSVVLREYKNAHTPSDAIMVLPGEGIVFMGDMLFVQYHPFLGEGNPDSLKRYLGRIHSDASLKVFVPGHGPVGDKASLQQEIGYISHLQQEVTASIQNKEPDSVYLRRAMPAPYDQWLLKRFYRINKSILKRKHGPANKQ